MATLTLQPDGAAGLDTTIRQDLATNNSGTSTEIRLGEDAGGGAAKRVLIKFDLSSLPANAIVTAATLTLTMTTDESINARVAEVFEVLRAWVETQATWNIWSTGNNWTTAGCSGADTDFVNTVLANASYTATETIPSTKAYAFNAAGLAWIQAVAAGSTTNNGWLIKMQTELSDAYRHSSSDHATEGNRPLLVVEYSLGFTPRAMSY